MISTTNRHFNNIHKIYCQIAPYQAYLGIILLRLTFDIVYVFIVNPVYSYSGFLLEFFAYKYVLSWIVTLMMTPFIVNLYKNSSVSSTIILLINLIYFIPGCTLYSLYGLPDSYFLFYVLYWILLMIWQYQIPYVHFKLPPERVSKQVFYFIIIVVAIGAIAISGIYNSFQMNLRLDNVYELRRLHRDMNLSSVIAYFQPMASILIPLVLVYFLAKKRYALSFLAIIIQILLFSFGGMKSYLYLIPVAIFGYYFYREKRMGWFSWGLVALNISALLEFITRNTYLISGYLLRRTMFVPNINSSFFFDYFSVNSPDFLFQSLLRRFGFLSQYDIQIPYIIGLEYYNDITCSANNGLVGDAFCNFAWLGLVIFPLFIILALRFMDACAHGIDRRLLITVFVWYAVSFGNSSYFTVMLTHAFLFMCFMLYLMPREGKIFRKGKSYDESMPHDISACTK